MTNYNPTVLPAYKPTYGMNGGITGYGNVDPVTGIPVGNNRYSGAGGASTSVPRYGANGVILDSVTGQPYTGSYNGTHVKNGVQLQLDPVTGTYDTADNIAQRNAKVQNNPAQRYQAVNIDKNPDIESATTDLVKQFQDTAASSLKDFKDYLGNFKSDVTSARDAGKVATDPSQTIAALTSANTNYQGQLGDANNRYQTALNTGQTAENNIVTQAQNELPAYDTAAQNVADQEQKALVGQLSRYKLSSGTPTSGGSDEQQALLQGVQNIQLPTQLAKIQRQYDVYGNYALPVTRDITGRDVTYAGNFLPSVAGAGYSANTGTANNIQNLKMQVANMSFDDATRYMQSLGIPWAVQSQILQGNVSALGGLNTLESGSRYQGLQDKLGVNVSQPQGYSFNAPPMPTYSASYPNGGRYGGGQTQTATNGGTPASSPNPSNPAAYDPSQFLSLMGGVGMPGFPNPNNQLSPAGGGDFYDSSASSNGNYFA